MILVAKAVRRFNPGDFMQLSSEGRALLCPAMAPNEPPRTSRRELQMLVDAIRRHRKDAWERS